MMTYQWLEGVPDNKRSEYTGSQERLAPRGLYLREREVVWAMIDFVDEHVRGATCDGFFQISFEAPNPFSYQES